ncbi:GNAT superfamily N-acetyltransferase [Catenuloplanes nepalensis]|uniref:GNAT superfamily N-acetyltransferase n=1 Tax=Catenuloplanes nepalensis TaxID=587533 RepID=A0ABT9MV86_9ACTN|nr:GNAT family N-acetyltransferase [Catenuloplanes nepalensis]MDP9795347.1 GNAT superfamily N-acetyltransferase [Catenuloplanes nepalensis]
MPHPIRLATAADLAFLPPIEVAAGAAFACMEMHDIAVDAPPTLDELSGYQQNCRAWVAVAGGAPVAYLLAERVDGGAHVEQVTVHPDHAGNRTGAALIDRCAEWGRSWGARRTTLTTFTDVPWNAPYYARLGFTAVPPEDLTPGLAAIRADEAARGLDRWPRAVMSRDS